MDKIDNNKLITLFTYGIVVIVLTSILYSMYNDFLSENYFNIKKFNLKEKFTDSDIDEKLKYINLISNTKKSTEKFTEIIQESYDLSIPYILKAVPTLPKCNKNDTLSNSNCIMSTPNLYVQNGSSFIIQVLRDGEPCSYPNDIVDDSQLKICDYTKTLNNLPMPIARQTHFSFPNSLIRSFSYSNSIDKSIITYFNNYIKYNNYISNSSNQILNSSNNDTIFINKYFGILQNLLLLKNSSDPNNIFAYNSGYTYDIATIKTKLITLYTNLISTDTSRLKYGMYIDDQTTIKFLTDASKNVYSMELYPNITITFKNLVLGFDKDAIASSGISDLTSIWNLNFLNLLTPTKSSKSIIYSYKPNPIYFPIVISFLLPSNNNNEWKIVNPNTNSMPNYFDTLFKINTSNLTSNLSKVTLLNTNVSTILPNLTLANNIFQSKIKTIIDTSTITDIFALYDSTSNLFQSHIITNGYATIVPSATDVIDINSMSSTSDYSNKTHTIYPIISFNPIYTPNACDNGILIDNKCYPKCPNEFSYDINIACLNNNRTMYVPNSEICKYLLENKPSEISNDIHSLINLCLPPVTESFTNITTSMSENSIDHFSPFSETININDDIYDLNFKL